MKLDDRVSATGFLDSHSLDILRQKAAASSPDAINGVARQFEAMYVGMMLQGMRAADDSLPGEDYFSSDESRFYQEMMDKELAGKLASGKGIGLAAVIERQLSGGLQTTAGQAAQPEETIKPQVAPELPQSIPLRMSPALALPLDRLRFEVGMMAGKATPENTLPIAHEKAGTVLSTQVLPAAAVAEKPAVDTAPAQPGRKQAFIDAVMPHAIAAGRRLGVDPRVLIAQAALETGWGKTLSQGNNLFGIKASRQWQGEIRTLQTTEFRQGVRVRETAGFRAYGSVAESFSDYVNLVSNSPRYQKAVANAADAGDYLRHLQKAGYATDPLYAEKIQRIMNTRSISVALARHQDAMRMAGL